MNENKNSESNSQKSLKSFFIKLISVSIASVIVVNLIFNLIFAEKLEKIDKILLLNKSQFRNEMKKSIEDLNTGSRKETESVRA